MSDPMTQCEFCKKGIESTDPDNADIYRYHCDRCGDVHVAKVFFMLEKIRYVYDSDRHLISGYTRERTEDKRPPIVIDCDNIKELLDSLDIPRSASEKTDKILFYLEKHSEFFGDSVPIDTEKDYPIIYTKYPQELHSILLALVKSGSIEEEGRQSFKLTIKGFNRVDKIHKTRPKSNQCFVAMWFDESLDDVFEKGIERAIQDAGFTPIRVDILEHNEKICDRIIAEIRKSKFFIYRVLMYVCSHNSPLRTYNLRSLAFTFPAKS